MYSEDVNFILFHAYHYIEPTPSISSVPVMSKTKLFDTKREAFDEEIAVLQEDYPQYSIEGKFRLGRVLPEIAKYVEEEHIDLIVCGYRAKSNLMQWVEGLNAYEIAKEATVPVLIIPKDAECQIPRKVVFATDFGNLENLNILDELRNMVRKFEPNFMTLHVYSEKDTAEEDREKMNEMLTKYFNTNTYKHYFLELDDPVKGIEEFIVGYNADMLALVGKDRKFFDKLFHKSVTKQLIIDTHIPVLILNYPKIEIEKDEKAALKVRVREQLREWKADIEALNVQLNLGKTEAKEGWSDQKVKAKERLEVVKSRLGEAEGVAEDKWDHFKEEMGEALGHIKKAFVGKKETS